MPLRDARMEVAKDVQEALDIAAAWNPEGADPAPVIALRHDPGLGKSRTTRELLAGAETMDQIKGDVHFYAPSLALADEGADHAQELGLSHAVTRGRLAKNPATGQTMCARPAEVERVGKLGQPIKPTLCISKDEMGMERKCPFYDSCAHRLPFFPDAGENVMDASLKSAEAYNNKAGAKAQFWTNLRQAAEGGVEDLQNVLLVAGYKPQKKRPL